MASNTVGIDITVTGGDSFKKVMENLRSPVEKLDAALVGLASTINSLGTKISGSNFQPIKELSVALSALFDATKGQKTSRLEGTRDAVKALIQILNLLNSTGLNIGTGFISRVQKINQLKSVFAAIANSLKSLDKIRNPQNLKHTLTAIEALGRILRILDTDGVGKRLIDLSSGPLGRAILWTRFRSIVSNIAKALTAFNVLKRPERVAAAATAINALARLIRELSAITKLDQQLTAISIVGKSKQFLGVQQFLDTGLPKFIRSIATAMRVMTRIPRAATSNIRYVSTFLNSIARLITEVREAGNIGGFENVAVGLDGFISSLANSMRKLRSIPTVKMAGVNSVLGMFRQLRESGDLPSLDKQTGNFASRIVENLVSIPRRLLSGFLEPLRRIFESAGGLKLTSIGSALVSSLSAALSAGSWLTSTALRVGKQIGTTLISGIKLAIKTLTFPTKIFSGLVTQAQQAVQSILRSFSSLSQNLRNIGREMSQVGRDMLLTGGLSAFVQGRAAGSVMDFESAIKQIEVLGGVVGNELAVANRFILELGESSVFNANQVAAAFLDLSKSGLDVVNTMSALPPIMDLAAAGSIEVAEASGLVISASKAFNISFDESERVVNAFVAAANVGVAEVSDLAAAFPYVSASAAAFGQELEGTLATLTLLRDRGLEGSTSGRALATMFTSLISPSTEAAGSLAYLQERIEMFPNVVETLGLSPSDVQMMEDGVIDFVKTSDGQFRDLNDIVELLAISMQGISEAERAALLTDIAGSQNSARVLLALVDSYEKGTGTVEEYQQAMENSASASTVAASLMDTTRGALEELSGAFETLLIKAITPIMKYGITPLSKALTTLIRAVSSLPQPILTAISAFVGFNSVLLTVGGAMLFMTGMGLRLIGLAILPLASALQLLLNPLNIIKTFIVGGGVLVGLVGPLLALAPLLVTLAAGIKGFKDGLDDLRGTPVLGAFTDAVDRLRSVFETTWNAGKRLLDVVFTLTSNTGYSANTGPVAFIVNQLTILINRAADAVEAVGTIFEILTGFSFTNELGIGKLIDVPLQLPTPKDLLDEAGFTPQAFEDAFGIVAEGFGDRIDFIEGFELLRINSYNWSEDIAQWREMTNVMDGMGQALQEVTVDLSFLKVSPQPIQEITTRFKTLDEVMSGLTADNAAFAQLSEQLDKFKDTAIVELLFGKDATGADIARLFATVLVTIDNLRNEVSGVVTAFMNFFDNLRNGIPLIDSINTLLSDIVKSAARFAAIGLDVFSTIFGIDSLDNVIQNFYSGKVVDGLRELGKIFAQAMLSSLVSALKTSLGIVASVIDSVLGTNVYNSVQRIFKDIQRIIDGITRLFKLSGGGSGSSSGKSLLVRLIDSIFGGAVTIVDTIADVVEFIADLRDSLDKLSFLSMTLSRYPLFTSLLGGTPEKIASSLSAVLSILRTFAASIGNALSSVFNLIRGNISFVDFVRDLIYGIADALKSGGNMLLGMLGQPLGDIIKQAWDTGIALAGALISAAPARVTIWWNKIIDFVGAEDLVSDISTVVSEIESALKPLTTLDIGSAIDIGQDVGSSVFSIISQGIRDMAGAFEVFAGSFNKNILADAREFITWLADINAQDIRNVGIAIGLLGGAALLATSGLTGIAIVDFIGIGIGFATLAALPYIQLALVAAAVYGLANALPDLADAIGELLAGNFIGAAEELGNAFSTFIDSIAGLGETVVDPIAKLLGFSEEWQIVKDGLTWLGDGFSSLATGIGNLIAQGPVGTIMTNLSDSLKNMESLDWKRIKEGVIALGVSIFLYFSPILIISAANALAALAVSLGGLLIALAPLAIIALAAIMVINGLARAIDPLVAAFNDLINLRIADALGNLLWAVAEFALGAAEILAPVAQAILDALGIDVDVQERLDGVSDAIDNFAFYADLVFRKLWLDIRLETARSIRAIIGNIDLLAAKVGKLFGWNIETNVTKGLDEDVAQLENEIRNLKIEATERGLGDRIEVPLELEPEIDEDTFLDSVNQRMQEALAKIGTNLPQTGDDFLDKADLNRFMSGSGGLIIPIDVDADDLNTSISDASDTISVETGEMETEVTDWKNELSTVVMANNIDLAQLQTDVIAASATVQAEMAAMRGAVDNLKAGIILLRRVNKIQLDGMLAELIELRPQFVAEFNFIKTAVQGLVSTLEKVAQEWTITVSIGNGAAPEGRALGGPVFAGNLYEVAEGGLSELLQIGGRTFLIPGQSGMIIPPTRISNLTQPYEAGSPYGDNGFRQPGGSSYNTYVEYNGDTIVEVNGSDLSREELQDAIVASVAEIEQARQRQWSTSMRSRGSF